MDLWGWLFPRRCVGCSRLGKYVCSECVNFLKVRRNHKCVACGKGSMYGMTHSKCMKPLMIDGVLGVFEYKGSVGVLIRKVKYKKVSDVFSELVELVVSLGDFGILESGGWLVVAVPLHKTREKERGFNQAEWLARMLSGYFGWEFVSRMLVRNKATRPQASLGWEARKDNVKGVFGLANEKDRELIKDREVLVVDDVSTTGATIRECAKVLKRAGAKKVWGLVVAS